MSKYLHICSLSFSSLLHSKLRSTFFVLSCFMTEQKYLIATDNTKWKCQASDADLQFLPLENVRKKSLDNLPPFTSNLIVRYIQKSGKHSTGSGLYRVNFIEGYLYNILVEWHKTSDLFYLRALWYQSLRKSEALHKLKLAISIRGPSHNVLGLLCMCVAGALGFCNHTIGLMCLVPDNLACTLLPQQWHKPRGKTIS